MNEVRDLSFKDMFAMQTELWEKHKDYWTPMSPEYAKNMLLWLMTELGEVIDIFKKKGDGAIMGDEVVRGAFIEEMCDVLMYFNDTLLRCGVTPQDLASAYVKKHRRNMRRDFKTENDEFLSGG